jgi:hypothetical protein
MSIRDRSRSRSLNLLRHANIPRVSALSISMAAYNIKDRALAELQHICVFKYDVELI